MIFLLCFTYDMIPKRLICAILLVTADVRTASLLFCPQNIKEAEEFFQGDLEKKAVVVLLCTIDFQRDKKIRVFGYKEKILLAIISVSGVLGQWFFFCK